MGKLIYLLITLNIIGTATGAVFTYKTLSEPLVQPPVPSELNAEEFLVHHNVFSDKPILYSLDTFTVNLSSVEEDKVVLIELNLEMHDEKSYEEVVSKSAIVRDTVVKVLADRRYDELTTVQGKLFLKDDISLEVNRQLKYGLIKGVYFTKFLVQ